MWPVMGMKCFTVNSDINKSNIYQKIYQLKTRPQKIKHMIYQTVKNLNCSLKSVSFFIVLEGWITTDNISLFQITPGRVSWAAEGTSARAD